MKCSGINPFFSMHSHEYELEASSMIETSIKINWNSQKKFTLILNTFSPSAFHHRYHPSQFHISISAEICVQMYWKKLSCINSSCLSLDHDLNIFYVKMSAYQRKRSNYCRFSIYILNSIMFQPRIFLMWFFIL